MFSQEFIAAYRTRAHHECSPQTQRPPAIGRPFIQGRIVPTEAKPSKLFCKNLMSLDEGVSSDFLDLNVFNFNNLQKFHKNPENDKLCHSGQYKQLNRL
jgi:hypothetical protein